MNLAGAFILLVLIVGSVMAVFAVAASQPTTPYVDTYGNTTSLQSNNTQKMITNTTATPLIGGLGIGAVIIAAVFVLFLASIIVWRPYMQSGRR
jgi:hypothetical protein